MKHYNSEEWRNLGKGLNNEIQIEMEKHLLDCDACLQLFLEGIDQASLEEARNAIPSDFTVRSCSLIKAGERKTERYPAHFQRKGLLAYYAAAAAITIMLTGGGVFQSLNNAKMNLQPNPAIHAGSKYEAILFNWPAQLQEKTAELLNTIELRNFKEVK